MKYFFRYCLVALTLFSCKNEVELKQPSDIIGFRCSTVHNFDNLDRSEMPRSLARLKYFRVYDKQYNHLGPNYMTSSKYTQTADAVALNNRFQAVVDQFFASENPSKIFNMLNFGAIIDEQGAISYNTDTYGPAWIIDNLVKVDDPNAEMVATGFIEPRVEALVLGAEFQDELKTVQVGDGKGTIFLTDYSPDRRVYSSNTQTPQLAVISELWNPQGLQVTVNGEAAKVIRVNGLLYAVAIPAGKAEIVFENH